MHDVRSAVRSLVATPLVSLVACLSLALGIGANTAIFSLVNSLLLRSLPVADPTRLVVVNDPSTFGSVGSSSWNYAIWDNIRQRSQDIDDAYALASPLLNLHLCG